ncbi:hypothetical protein PPL_02853 [Heterostelium album PN500]|uniref:N-acetyltransferase domain-containing protein n=1 Tax=Heterostelium pallidum (strain ATCC 26659 / Pp 5 / PN500) TaxID=670386 RepID=D3B387_HETP5|nr:hypothetical protein PPL_02853 [Heterostelium album PN500]EFA83785.1 hypothetical protein PPL_02853 [Heterostelium album PN500]|eukprot:XP_020435902.1 hypothetical protein PPL_02853 [Heterostelium album PN500]
MTVKIITIDQFNDGALNNLVTLLIDSVQSGASVGFIAPLPRIDAVSYWLSVQNDLKERSRFMLIAIDENTDVNSKDSLEILGSVQLSLCMKKNGLHRAEVEKLMVKSTHRGKGIATVLMNEIERLAKNNGRTLLVLDTRQDDVASRLYTKLSYIEAGVIPQYALSSNGELSGTTYFYKLL